MSMNVDDLARDVVPVLSNIRCCWMYLSFTLPDVQRWLSSRARSDIMLCVVLLSCATVEGGERHPQ